LTSESIDEGSATMAKDYSMTVADAVAGVLAGETGDLLREAVCPPIGRFPCS